MLHRLIRLSETFVDIFIALTISWMLKFTFLMIMLKEQMFFIHIHWSHNGTSISGTLIVEAEWTYSKGHGQSSFAQTKIVSISYPAVNIVTTPRYIHRIEEVQLSTKGGSASLLDTDLIEPDGLFLIRIKAVSIPSISGGSPDKPTILFCDIHAQSMNIGTKQRSPNFYI